jgi:rod shape-determining protein MreD
MFKIAFEKAYLIVIFSVLLILSHLPFLFDKIVIKPNFMLIGVFCFTLTLNSNYSLLFIIFGLIQDYIDGVLVGISSLQYILTSMLVENNRKAIEEQKFIIIWAAFSIVTLICYITKISILSIFHKILLFNNQQVFEMLLTISFYPVLTVLITSSFNRLGIR